MIALNNLHLVVPSTRVAVSAATFARLATEHLGALRVPVTELEVDTDTDALDDALRAAGRAAIDVLGSGDGWVLLSGKSTTTPGADRWVRVEAGEWSEEPDAAEVCA